MIANFEREESDEEIIDIGLLEEEEHETFFGTLLEEAKLISDSLAKQSEMAM